MAAQPMVGWVSSGNDRNTSDIIWSCFSVILICTWKVMHMNMPCLEERQATWREWPRWRKYLRKAKWMVIMMLAPEIALSTALDDWLAARSSVEQFKRLLDIVTASEASNVREKTVSEQETPQWSVVHAQYANMGGFTLTIDDSDGHRKEFPLGPSYLLDAGQVLTLIENTSLNIPSMSKDDIKDKSKADGFTKALACIQSGWLILECIARSISGLAITELELATMGFVCCALVMYILWKDKPFNTEHTTYIHCPYDRRVEVLKLLGIYHSGALLFPASSDRRIGRTSRLQRFRNYTGGSAIGKNSLGGFHVSTIWMIAIGTCFSAIHIAAWSFQFPTHTEQTIWRVVSITATAVCAVFIPMTMVFGPNILGVLVAVYVSARLTLLVQIFLCFRSMPANVYETIEWVKYLPHFT